MGGIIIQPQRYTHSPTTGNSTLYSPQCSARSRALASLQAHAHSSAHAPSESGTQSGTCRAPPTGRTPPMKTHMKSRAYGPPYALGEVASPSALNSALLFICFVLNWQFSCTAAMGAVMYEILICSPYPSINTQ